jgi:hypothetical protein
LQRSATPALEDVENGVEQRGVHGVRTGLLAPSFACRTYRQPLILLDRGQGKVNAIRARRGRWGVTIYIVAGHFGREEKREKRGLNWAGGCSNSQETTVKNCTTTARRARRKRQNRQGRQERQGIQEC